MTYALYTNPGTLDMRAVTIMGLHAKPNSDSPIGDFGTGLKYSIAVLLRFNAFITIQAGDGNEYHVRKENSDFRGEEIEQLVLVNVITGVETLLPYTTRLGKNWGLWQVMRELECNARDEGGEFLWADRIKPGEPNTVNIYVDCPDFIEAIKQQRSTVFFDQLTRKGEGVLYAHTDFEYLKQPSPYLYCRGIRVAESTAHPFARTYNFTKRLKLTEDRTLEYMFSIHEDIGSQLALLDDEAELTELMTAEGSWEYQYIFDSAVHYAKSDAFDRVATRLWKQGQPIPDSVARYISRKALQEEMKKRSQLSAREDAMLSTAIAACEWAGYPVRDYEIKVVNRLRDNVLGMADAGKQMIFLSKLAFEQGLECVTATLIEEWLHLSRGVHDCSREMQDWLLRQLTIRIMDRFCEEKDDTSSS